MHRFQLHNGRVEDTSTGDLRAGQVGLLNGWGVFSTIRVSDGVLFAFERHWERMKRDAAVMHVPFPDDRESLRRALLSLVEANRAYNATLRVAVIRNRGGVYESPNLDRDFDVIAFTTDLANWGDSVSLWIKPQGRHAACEFAGTKVLSWAQNLTWYEEAHQKGFDEVILLNEHGEVSECTSANIFIAEGNQVWTPPLTSGCLPGVTRAILLEEIHVPGISVGERTLMPADLERADQVFITSTTRDLLPVRHIEGLTVKSIGTVVQSLQESLILYRRGGSGLQPAVGSQPVFLQR
jgi:branched-chain amino acid aminotransferase